MESNFTLLFQSEVVWKKNVRGKKHVLVYLKEMTIPANLNAIEIRALAKSV